MDKGRAGLTNGHHGLSSLFFPPIRSREPTDRSLSPGRRVRLRGDWRWLSRCSRRQPAIRGTAVEGPAAGGRPRRERDHGRALAGSVPAANQARLEVQDGAEWPVLPGDEWREMQLAQRQSTRRLERP